MALQISTQGYVAIISNVLAQANTEPVNPYEKGCEVWDSTVAEMHSANISRAKGYFLVRERTARLFAERCTGIQATIANPRGIKSRESARAMLWAYLKGLAHSIRYENHLLRIATAHLIVSQ